VQVNLDLIAWRAAPKTSLWSPRRCRRLHCTDDPGGNAIDPAPGWAAVSTASGTVPTAVPGRGPDLRVRRVRTVAV